MLPILAWAIGAGAGALYAYLKQSNDEPEPDRYGGVGWSGSTKSTLPRVVTRRVIHDTLCGNNGFLRIRSSEEADEYFRGDENITSLPASRSIRWGEVPLFLTARYSPDGAATKIELRFAAPEAVSFDQNCMAFFHEHAEREFDGLLESFRMAASCASTDGSTAKGGNGTQRPSGSDSDYSLLGLTRGASWEQVQAAYRDACLKYHPDRLGGQSVPPHLVDLAVREFRARTDAYQRLRASLAA